MLGAQRAASRGFKARRCSIFARVMAAGEWIAAVAKCGKDLRDLTVSNAYVTVNTYVTVSSYVTVSTYVAVRTYVTVCGS